MVSALSETETVRAQDRERDEDFQPETRPRPAKDGLETGLETRPGLEHLHSRPPSLPPTQ